MINTYEVICMKRSGILCPECFKKKLLIENDESKEAYCDGCGTNFIIVGENTVKYA